MKIVSKIEIEISVDCKRYIKGSSTISEGESVSISLELEEKNIVCFLFKYTDNSFDLGNYKVSTTHIDNKPLILFKDTTEVYIVTNPNKFLSDLLEAYERIRFSKRLNNLFDLENAYWVADSDKSDKVIDEFDFEDSDMSDQQVYVKSYQDYIDPETEEII